MKSERLVPHQIFYKTIRLKYKLTVGGDRSCKGEGGQQRILCDVTVGVGKGGGYNPPICSVILLDDIPLTD